MPLLQTTIDSGSEEPPLGVVYSLDELEEDERKTFEEMLPNGESFQAAVISDLRATGDFGPSRLVLGDEHLSILEREDEQPCCLELKTLQAVRVSEFVGNGRLEALLKDSTRITLIRFTRTRSENFREFADLLNDRLEAPGDAFQQDEKSSETKTTSRGDRSGSYRCPNCGYPLEFASDACPRCTNKSRVFARLAKHLRGHTHLFVAGLVLSTLATAANLGPGFLVRLLVDTALNPTATPPPDLATRSLRLSLIVGAFFGLLVVRMLCQRFRILCMGKLGEGVVRSLRTQLFRHLHRLSLSYYDSEHTGRIMARVTSDTRQVQRFITRGLQQMIIHSLMVIGISIILLLQNAMLAAIALLPVVFVVILGRTFSKKFRGIYRAIRRRFADLTATVSDSVSGIRVVKSFATEDQEIDTFVDQNEECYDAHISAIEARARFRPSVVFLMSVGTIVVWFIGGRMVLQGALTLGILLQFITYMNMFRNPVKQLLNLTEVFQQSATAAERVFNIFDMPSEVRDHDQAIGLDSINGRIVLDNVTFAYTENDDPVLKNINLTIEPGETVGLVGATGSGKSTLASLVCRFYDPTHGRITLDGQDLRDIQLQSLRNRIGVVLQDTFLFAGSIRENIAYANPETDMVSIIAAAKAANAHEFIMEFPDAYDTEVGEHGTGLSGGERQRIAIARAILRDPDLLILDEATSAVDTATEAMIQSALDRLIEGRTTIAIAHRLSTLRNADKLVVLEDGEIVEKGTHDELLEADGVYAHLHRIQTEFADGSFDADEALKGLQKVQS